MHGSVDAKKSAEDALINNFNIGNTYFVYVDGCWVAVDVDGFTYTERVICTGDPDLSIGSGSPRIVGRRILSDAGRD